MTFSPSCTPYYDGSLITVFLEEQSQKNQTRHQIYETILEDRFVPSGEEILKKARINAGFYRAAPEKMTSLNETELKDLRIITDGKIPDIVIRDLTGSDFWSGKAYAYFPQTLHQERHITIINTQLMDPYVLNVVKSLAMLFPQIQKIVLFGSRAREKTHKHSDYDLAVITDDNLDFTTWRQIADQVSIADKITKIDCVHFNKASQGLKNEIMREGKPLYVR